MLLNGARCRASGGSKPFSASIFFNQYECLKAFLFTANFQVFWTSDGFWKPMDVVVLQVSLQATIVGCILIGSDLFIAKQ